MPIYPYAILIAQAVGEALITFLKLFAHCVQIYISHNGKVFAQYKRINFYLTEFFSSTQMLCEIVEKIKYE